MRPMRPSNGFAISDLMPGLRRLVSILLTLLPLLALSGHAFASAAPSGDSADLTTYAEDVGDATDSLPDIINYVAYIMGSVLVALGLTDLKKTTENPQQHPIKHGLAKLFAGGAFLGLPELAGVFYDTMYNADPFALVKTNAFTFNKTAVNQAGISGLIANAINNSVVLVDVAAFIGFCIATFFTVRGIQMMRAHVDNPGQAPLPEALKRMAVGGALYSLPMIVNVVYETFGAHAKALGNTGWSSTNGTAGGLDGMMVNFMRDLTNPAFFGIEIFCYIAGILMVLFAMQRLVRTAQDGPRGPLGFGTIVMFFVAGALLSFPQLLSVFNNSIFSDTAAQTKVNFMSMAGVDAAQVQNAKNIFSAVLAFMAVIGFLSVVRGLFILKGFADGNQQATMMSVVTHIVAGALCINLGGFINAIQTSLGVTTFPVTFN